jgi:hydroxymethylbilane synthase
MVPLPVTIGTRGSPLALAQTEQVRRLLAGALAELAAADAVRIATIRTSGDKFLDRTLSEIGGKGLFTKEIDEALLAGRIDLAVHSMKDLPTWLPDGIVLACMLPREDPRDAFIGRTGDTLIDLPPGAVVGTASLRRKAQILHHRPDLNVIPLRGNVQTRLKKVAERTVDATLLAVAGLKRLDMADAATAILSADELLPAVGQGAIGITCRTEDDDVRGLLSVLNHDATKTAVMAERAMLEVLDGSCRTPIAALAQLDADDRLSFRGLIARPDGSRVIRTHRDGVASDAWSLGRDAGQELRRRGGPDFFDGAA